MIPIVTLIGRPNVGKSTLFNKLTDTRDALVADIPGITRNRKYGCVEWEGYRFIIVDTCSINSVKININTSLENQSLISIKESDIILFVMDGCIGPTSGDRNIVNYLYKCHKSMILVVNKVDNIDSYSTISEFYRLGNSSIVSISAVHGNGICSLIQEIRTLANNSLSITNVHKKKIKYCIDNCFVATSNNRKKDCNSQPLPTKLAIVGRSNAGKSTIINTLLGKERVTVCNIPGTTSDSIYIPMLQKKNKYILIDTAGVNRFSKFRGTIEGLSFTKTMQAIENSNIVLAVIDASIGISNQDLYVLRVILNKGKPLVIAVNKWDSIPAKERKHVKQSIIYRIGFVNFVHIHFISALQNHNMDKLLKSINETHNCSNIKIRTPLINRIMHTATNIYCPPSMQGRHATLKYAHVGGYNPLTIVIHGTHVRSVPNSYKRYLANYFRSKLSIIGTPLFVQFKETNNAAYKYFNFKSNT